MREYAGVTNGFIERTEKALSDSGVNITVRWDTVRVQNSSRVVDVTCNRCNSTVTRVTKSLAKGVYYCQDCVIRSYKNKLDSYGFTFIEHGDKQLTKCRCNVCNTETLAATASYMTGNKPRCEGCLRIKYTEAASKIGYEYIGKTSCASVSGTVCEIRCITDNHILEVSSGHLLVGHVSCPECQIRGYREALEKKGCELLEVVRREKYGKTRLIYKGADGTVLEATAGNVLYGKFTPTKDTHWKQPTEVYCIVVKHNGCTYLKIGTANNSESRMKDLQLDVDSKEVHVLAKFEDRFLADEMEQHLHDTFNQYRIDKSIPASFTNLRARNKLSSGERKGSPQGITEWFDSSIFQAVLDYKV